MIKRMQFIFFLMLFCCTELYAVTIELYYSSIQQHLMTEVFNSNGKKYLMGDTASKCVYAFLDSPEVSAISGRLKISSFVSAELGTEYNGKCIGVKDRFRVVMTGIPYYRNGVLGLEDVRVENLDTKTQFGQVAQSYFQTEMPKILKVDLESEIQKNLAQKKKEILAQISVTQLIISQIKVESDRIVLECNFDLTIR